ncbi:MAG TPA: ring oxydation complex/ phenylacetic acid degradation, partial [Acidobacteria bacterium]|nr:ring oxydation complex/ phenylacetic acid degradation [Acidobacteriota bacterium]
STEFGSIQQHRLTLARAQEEEEQFWILRMMAEELRHGYQMLHLL